nr:MAG TPA: hypothetical protein [Caudoviricetes sp.]
MLVALVRITRQRSLTETYNVGRCYYTNSYCIIRLYQKYNQQNWIHS